MNRFTASAPVSSETIADQVVTAFEGGITYWAESTNLVTPSRDGLKGIWYSDPKLYEGEFKILIVQHDEHIKDAGVNLYLTPDNIQTGLDLMASKYGEHFSDMMNENGDATTADVFIQCCVFGDLVYG
jgi:hypothetical protein